MTKGKITKSMLDNLEYDLQSKDIVVKMETVAAGQPLISPTALFVFANGDLNAAAYHLIQSMKSPFSKGAISSVFVEEAAHERFVTIVRPQLPKLDTTITQHEGFKKALLSIKRLNAKTIENSKNGSSLGAILVRDCTHEYLTSGASGVSTLNTFRTAKEAIALCSKEKLAFGNISIWTENHSCAYELVAAVNSRNFFINCDKVSLKPLETNGINNGNYVIMDKSYHYERFISDDFQKNIVFPVGTIFAN